MPIVKQSPIRALLVTVMTLAIYLRTQNIAFNRTVYFMVDLVKKHVSCHQLLHIMVAGKIHFSIARATTCDAPQRGSCEVRISIQDL